MPYDPKKHHRRSIRLKGYDYSQPGLYFITINVQDRKCLFGEIVNGEMILNDAGKMVENEWLKLPQRFPNIELHEYMVMPDHFHSILEIVGETLDAATKNEMGKQKMIGTDDDIEQMERNATNDGIGQPDTNAPGEMEGQPQGYAPADHDKKPKTVGDMVGAFQSIVTVEYIRGVKQLGWTPFNKKLFQRNYWEHIIRNEQSFYNISNYIINNPKNWKGGKFNR